MKTFICETKILISALLKYILNYSLTLFYISGFTSCAYVALVLAYNAEYNSTSSGVTSTPPSTRISKPETGAQKNYNQVDTDERPPQPVVRDHMEVIYFVTTRPRQELLGSSSEINNTATTNESQRILYGRAIVKLFGVPDLCSVQTIPANRFRSQMGNVEEIVLFPTLNSLVGDAVTRHGSQVLKNEGFLVYVHGFGTTFEKSMRRTAQVSAATCRNAPSILFSWESHGGTTDNLDDTFSDIGKAVQIFIASKALNDISETTKFIEKLSVISDGCGDEFGLTIARMTRFTLNSLKGGLRNMQSVSDDKTYKVNGIYGHNKARFPLSVREKRSLCDILSYKTIDGRCFEKYCSERTHAQMAAPAFLQFLLQLKSNGYLNNPPIILVAHSVGNLVVSDAVANYNKIGSNLSQDRDDNLVHRFISLAADVSEEEIERIARSKFFSKDIVISKSPLDMVLVISSIINGKTQSGLGGVVFERGVGHSAEHEANSTEYISVYWDTAALVEDAGALTGNKENGGVWVIEGYGPTMLKRYSLYNVDNIATSDDVSGLVMTALHSYHTNDPEFQQLLGLLVREQPGDAERILLERSQRPDRIWYLRKR